MQYNIIDTNNKKYKIISINGKNNNKFLMNILIGFSIKNLENNKINELINQLKIKLNKKISKKNNNKFNKFNKFNKSHLNILEKTLSINLIIYDNDFNKLYSGKNKSNNKIELIKKGNSYNVLIKNIKKNSKIIQKGGGVGEDFLNKLNNKMKEWDIINAYQNCGVYSVINKFLRYHVNEPVDNFEKILKSDIDKQENIENFDYDIRKIIYIKKLDNIIKETSGYKNLYRGIPNNILEKYKLKSENSKIKLNILNDAYTSSSKNIVKASEFSDSGGIIIKFNIPPGIKYYEMENEGEKEILIQRGTKFTNIEKVTNNSNKNKNEYESLLKKNFELYTADIEKIDYKQLSKENLNKILNARKSFVSNEINTIEKIKSDILNRFVEPLKEKEIIKFLSNHYKNADIDNTLFELGLEIDIICDANCNSKKNC